MVTLLQDADAAMRRLIARPRFIFAAVVTLAIGIGSNTAMFSIVYGLLLRPLPYADAGGIVHVGESVGGRRPEYLSNRAMSLLEGAESFEQIAGYGKSSVEWSSPDGVVTLRGARVSPSLFALLRATVHLGRFFAEDEAREGADGVVLLSHGAWTRRFASDANIVGTVVDLDGRPHTIVGVLAEGFYFPTPDGEFWTPLVVPPFMSSALPETGQLRITFLRTFSALARLAVGVSPERAAAEVQTILQNNATAFWGSRSRDGGSQVEVRVVPLQREMVGEYGPALLALAVATILVLLMACANMVGLSLAHGVTRQRALAVCAALGASRGRLVRQLLMESALLSGAGGMLGAALAALTLRVAPSIVPGDVPRLEEVNVDGMALIFALGLSIVTGLLFGAAPALQSSRIDPARALKEGSVQSASLRLSGLNRARAAVVVAQVAVALVLLVGASLLLGSFVRLAALDRGYDATNVVAARIRSGDLSARRAMTPESVSDLRGASWRFQDSLLAGAARLQRLSGVEAVGVSTRLPLESGPMAVTSFRLAGTPPPVDRHDVVRGALNFVSPGYFDVVRVRLRDGRVITAVDGAESPPALVINETLARELFGSEPAVGQRLVLAGSGGEPWEVVGVVADVHYGWPVAELRAEALVPLDQGQRMPAFFFSSLMLSVRTVGDPAVVVPFLREAVAAGSPGASMETVMTMDARLLRAAAQPRFYAVVVASFAAVALLLAAFGIYALLSYTVSQRQREIGLRMALGARRSEVLGLVVRQGAALTAAGILVGLVSCAVAVRLLASRVFGVATDDRLTFVAAPLVLAVVALVACCVPGLRATRIEPMDALRAE